MAAVMTEECTQYQDQGHQTCDDLRDDGESQCNATADQGYSSCSNWNQYAAWLCIAWTWIDNIVCIGWTWVENWVCHLWNWIANWVCIAWQWVKHYVVLGFFWLTYVVCGSLFWPCLVRSWSRCRSGESFPPNGIDRPGWVLTFNDDFTTGAFDPTKWQTAPWYGEPYLHSWASGTTPSVYLDPAGFSWGAGTVNLISSNQAMLGQTNPNWTDPQTLQQLPFDVPYRGAWLMWPNPGTLDQQYGYFEIRCRTPEPPEAYPAFWLIGRYDEPEEIDIFEFNVNGMPGAFTTTVHWGPDRPHKKMKVMTHQVCRPWQLFHIYACEWSPKEIRWYLDNQLIRVTTKEKIVHEFSYPLALVISTGPDVRAGHHPETGVYPNYLEVDYVRTYRRP